MYVGEKPVCWWNILVRRDVGVKYVGETVCPLICGMKIYAMCMFTNKLQQHTFKFLFSNILQLYQHSENSSSTFFFQYTCLYYRNKKDWQTYKVLFRLHVQNATCRHHGCNEIVAYFFHQHHYSHIYYMNSYTVTVSLCTSQTQNRYYLQTGLNLNENWNFESYIASLTLFK